LEHAKEMALDALKLMIADDLKDGISARKPIHKSGHAICLPMELSFPILIRWAREEQKLSLESLAEKIGMQYQNIQKLERLGSNPTLKTVSKIAQGLGIQIEMGSV
jgi:ribosome-binding protein aMBF1 (putative translation factor)